MGRGRVRGRGDRRSTAGGARRRHGSVRLHALGHVEDLDSILEKLSTAGIAPAYRTDFTMHGLTVDAVYLNTDDFGGVMLEYSQFKKEQ